MFAPGVRGEAARKYWIKYGMYTAASTALNKFVYAGLKQTDPDGSISGVRWDLKKAMDSFTKGDPSKWYHVPLPDINLNVAGIKFNPGRDRKNKKLYMHPGKQALEIGGYFTSPVSTLFGKSSPLIQIALKQLLGVTPYEGRAFPVRQAYKGGKSVPWDAAERGSKEEYISRGKELFSDALLPFGVRGLIERGVAPTVASYGGTFPISKGISLTKAEPMARKAFKSGDSKMVNRIREALADNGYNNKQIKAMLTRARKN